MSWVDVGQIVLTAIVSAGGVGFVGYCAVKACVKYIADALAKRYEAKLAQETEKYKSELSKKEYVSKTRFDAEFQIYRDLSSVYFDLVKEINSLVPIGISNVPADQDDRDEEEKTHLNTAVQIAVKTQDVLNKNAPFIPEAFYDAYDNILYLCRLQIDAVQRKWNLFQHYRAAGALNNDDFDRTKEINKTFREINNAIRKHLAALDVME